MGVDNSAEMHCADQLLVSELQSEAWIVNKIKTNTYNRIRGATPAVCFFSMVFSVMEATAAGVGAG